MQTTLKEVIRVDNKILKWPENVERVQRKIILAQNKEQEKW
jgi:hypothetical protein